MAIKAEAAYIFPGQGAQYVGMGKDLYDTFPEARKTFDKANELLGFDLRGLCFEGPSEKLATTGYSQPAILVASIAALRCLIAGFPDLTVKAALGLSLGEYSALVSAGSLHYDDAVKLVRARGRFMEEASAQNPGKMASIIGLERSAAEELCRKTGCEIANLNCPGQVVISGRNDAIDAAVKNAADFGARRSVILNVSGPFHSSFMSGAAEKLEDMLNGTVIKSANLPVVSNVDASYEKDPGKIRANLLAQLTNRTLFEDSIRLLVKSGVKTFFEIGPGKVLKGLLRRIDPGLTVFNIGTKEDIENLRRQK